MSDYIPLLYYVKVLNMYMFKLCFVTLTLLIVCIVQCIWLMCIKQCLCIVVFNVYVTTVYSEIVYTSTISLFLDLNTSTVYYIMLIIALMDQIRFKLVFNMVEQTRKDNAIHFCCNE